MVRRTTNSAAPGDRVRRPTAIRARTKTMTRGSLPETGRRSPFRDRSGFDWIWFLFRIRGRVRRRDFWLRFALPSTVIFMELVQVDLAAGGFDTESSMDSMSQIFAFLITWPQIAVAIKDRKSTRLNSSH